MCDVTLFWLLEFLAHQVDHCISEHTHTYTHTAGMLGCWIWPSILADGLGATLSVTIVTCSLFPLSLCLSLPVSSAKRRKMADKILPQRVRLHAFTFCCSVFFFSSVFFYLLCAKQEKKSGLFLIPKLLRMRWGPDDCFSSKIRREGMGEVIRRVFLFFLSFWRFAHRFKLE